MKQTEEYAVIDLEMTGLRVTKDRILELGAVLISDGTITDTYDQLVNPRRALPPEIIKLTGITDAMTAKEPDIASALPRFLDFIGDRTLIGHNLMFDYSFIKQNAVNLSMTFERNGIDTLKIARKFLDAEQGKSLGELCTLFGIKREHAHRACDDAKETAQIFLLLREKFQKEHPEAFESKPLQYKVKKQSPLSPMQKRDLMKLVELYHIRPDIEIDSLTKSEASRLLDRIYQIYGKPPKEVMRPEENLSQNRGKKGY